MSDETPDEIVTCPHCGKTTQLDQFPETGDGFVGCTNCLTEFDPANGLIARDYP